MLSSIKSGNLYHIHVSSDCKSFGSTQNLNGTTRTREKPQGDGSVPSEVEGNENFALALWIILMCMYYGVYFSFEHPRQSRALLFLAMVWIIAQEGVWKVDFDDCAWGKRPSDWNPLQGDLRTFGPSMLITNNRSLSILQRGHGEVDPHEHETVLGQSRGGTDRSKDKAEYPRAFCEEFARSLRNGWLTKDRGVPNSDVPFVWLSDLVSNPNCSRES